MKALLVPKLHTSLPVTSRSGVCMLSSSDQITQTHNITEADAAVF